MHIKKSNIKVNAKVIYFLFIPLIVIGKIIRHTIMKEVLVDTGIGHHFIFSILYGNNDFAFFGDSGVAEAGGNTIVIFRILNLFKLSTYIEFEIYISIIWNIILFFLFTRIKRKLSLAQAIFVMLSIIVLNIFDFTLAKEPIQMLYFIAIYLVLMSNKLSDRLKNVFSIGMIVIASMTFRSYYILIAFFVICNQILCTKGIIKNKNIKFKTIIKLILCLGIIYFIFLNACQVLSPDIYTELIRVRTRESMALSDMRNILPTTNLIYFTLDYLIMLVRMVVPIELLPLGIKYWPYVIYQIMITYFIVQAVRNMKNNSKIKNMALFIYLGFLFGSATFEPDFGSWVRHEAVVFPILLLLADSITGKTENVKNLEEDKTDV